MDKKAVLIIFLLLLIACRSPFASEEDGTNSPPKTTDSQAGATTETPSNPLTDNTSDATSEVETTVPNATSNDEPNGQAAIVIGGRDFTEQYVLAEILKQVLEDAGYKVIDETGLGGNEAHEKLQRGEVDIIWDYIGTILALSHRMPGGDIPSDTEQAFEQVSELDANKYNLVWLSPSKFYDTYTLLVKPNTIALDLETIEDLADYMNDNGSPLKLCVESDFYERPDGLTNLQAHYDFAFKEENIEIVAYDQLYEGLRDGLCNVAEGFSTDGRIFAWDFKILDDSNGYFPAYNASPIVRQAVLNEYPDLEALLTSLGEYLDNDTMTQLNARVDIGEDKERHSGDEESVETVVHDFLKKNCLIGDCPELVVGGRDFTEQYVLAEILKQVLQDAGYKIVDQTGLGSNEAHEKLQRGEVDIIWDYIGTILALSHGLPGGDIPSDTEQAFNLVSVLDANHYNLAWLPPSKFHDTYTLIINPTTPNLADLKTIEDLASYMNQNGSPLKLCVESDFYERPDGLTNLQAYYGFTFQEENIEIVAYDQLYEGLRDELCEVAEAFSTDGRIFAWGFRRLEDSKGYFPAYNASLIIRQPVLEEYSEIETLLTPLGNYLDNDTMTKLNAKVDIGQDGQRHSGDEESVETVVRDFLNEKGLVGTHSQLTVGGRDFTEQYVLVEILKQVLQNAGYKVVDQAGLGGNEAHEKLQRGEVDIIWDYIGTILTLSHGFSGDDIPSDTVQALNLVAALDANHYNLDWLPPSKFNDTYTLIVTSANQNLANLKTIEDLADYMNDNGSPLKLCVESDFYERPDGLTNLQDYYGFAFKEENIEIVAYDQLYEGLQDSLCDVAEAFSTDGRIFAWGFRRLEDSKGYFPAYNASPIIRQAVLEEYSEIETLLMPLGDYLDNDTMTQLNALVDIGQDRQRHSGDEISIQTVATMFLCQHQLIREETCPDDLPPLTSQENGYLVTSGTPDRDLYPIVATATPPFPIAVPTVETDNTCQEIIVDGGFEQENGWDLPDTAWSGRYETKRFYSGNKSLRLGVVDEADRNSHSVARQPITLPADVNTAKLSYWYYPISSDLLGGDDQGLLIYDSTLSFLRQTVDIDISDEHAWIYQEQDLSQFIGDEIVLYFYVENDGDEQKTAMYIDNVSLNICTSPED